MDTIVIVTNVSRYFIGAKLIDESIREQRIPAAAFDGYVESMRRIDGYKSTGPAEWGTARGATGAGSLVTSKGSAQMSNEMSTVVANTIAETLREFSVPVTNLRGEEVTSVARVVGFEETGLLTRDAGFVVTLANGSEFQVTVVLSKRADAGVDCIECGMWFADVDGCSAHLVAEHGWLAEDAYCDLQADAALN